MTSTPREIGTLVVVILKAQHLPNKQRIGKQDPYCCVTLNGEKRRTRAIKRGGQHPEWDEEVRFTLYEDTEDMLSRVALENASTGNGSGTPPPVPAKADKKLKKIKGGSSMLVACFADDPKEPEFIGEGLVDLSEVLTKGETDEWFVLQNKDKFSGEVYLELTFWSNEKAPEKKKKPRQSMPNYGGPGSFMPSDSENSFGTMDSRTSLPESLRTNSSLGRLDLYQPSYGGVTVRAQGTGSMDHLADEFGGLNVNSNHSHGRRRESFPPPRTGHTPRPNDSTISSISTVSSYHSNHSDGRSHSSSPSTPVPRQHHRHSIGGPGEPFSAYQSPYDSTESGFTPSQSAPHSDYASSIYSIPSTSSGFASIPSASSGFAPVHPQTSSGFQPVPSHTPAPYGYGQRASSIFSPPPLPSGPSGFAAQQNYTPPASGFAPPPSSMSFHQPQQNYGGYQQYPPVPPTSAPPIMFPTAPSPSNLPNPPHSAPPQQPPVPNGLPQQPPGHAPYPGYAPATPPHTHQQSPQPQTTPQPHQYNPSPPIPAPVQPPGSRPLPQPIVQNGNAAYPPQTPPPPSAHSVFSASQSQGQGPSPTNAGYANTPPQSQATPPGQQQSGKPPLPVPPGPPTQMPMTIGPPPVNHIPYGYPQLPHQQNGFVAPPPPPPLRSVSGPASAFPKTDSRGSSPSRPPLPQPPQHNSNSSISAPVPGQGQGSGLPFPGSSMGAANGAGSSFHVPPPPPPLNKRAVSVSMSMPSAHPQPPFSFDQGQNQSQSQMLNHQRRSIAPGEVYHYGAPPRPPQMMYDENGSWHPHQSQ